MKTQFEKLEEARKFVVEKIEEFPKFLIVLGSGLANILNELEVETEISYSDIPHLAQTTVEGHVSRLVVGRLGGTRVACMQGRLHFYEGLKMDEVVFPFRVFALAGAQVFFLTNAAGGLHPSMKPADLVLIKDHLNLMGTNPLVGKNIAELGPRFPDMTHLYDPELRKIVRDTSKQLKIELGEGVYVGLHGPSYETPAEIKMYTLLGGDVVGMSTVPEAIALHHMGKRIVAISCVTNLAAGVSPTPLEHAEVLETAKKVQSKFCLLVKESVKSMEKVL
ncbi:MAG: purine-nucleoside phosphorylase [Proteobacteria bacterium]|nr:purine-nucleoside phosphorylase [Pseudomonadota bacterium]